MGWGAMLMTATVIAMVGRVMGGRAWMGAVVVVVGV